MVLYNSGFAVIIQRVVVVLGGLADVLRIGKRDHASANYYSYTAGKVKGWLEHINIKKKNDHKVENQDAVGTLFCF